MSATEKSAKKKFLDVEAVFKEKSPRLAKWIPGFVFSFVKRIVHQKEMNKFLSDNNDLHGVEFAKTVLTYFNINLVVKGIENLNDRERFEFASNHPLGGMEGIALMKIIAERFGDVRVPSNDILMKVKNFHPFFIPVNKYGLKSRDSFIQFEKSYASDIQILMFPAGFVSRKIDGKIQDIEWRKTFITKAIKHKRNIVPVFVDGRNSNLFYNIALFRKFFGIKVNFETFLLPDEMFKQKNKTITVYFGKPIHYSFFDKRLKQPEWAAIFREYVYNLSGDKCPDFKTFCSHKF